MSTLNKLKFKLPRHVLEVIYKSFIRPLLEYADIVWHGCTISDSRRIERVQYECSLTVSGAVRGSSYLSLLSELGWEKLSDRRHIHSLTMFHKIVHGHTRQYLQELITPEVSASTPYDLRNKHNLQSPACTTTRYQRSFIPYATYHWNGLDIAVRSFNPSIFKNYLIKLVRPSPNTHFSQGPRYACVLLTRLRIGTCSLNFSLFTRNLVDSPSCSCGSRCESVVHYLLYCPNYNQLRKTLLCNLQDLLTLDLKTTSDPVLTQLLLRGSPTLPTETNNHIMQLTQTYILQTNRFQTD